MLPLARYVKWGLARIDSERLVVDLEKVLAKEATRCFRGFLVVETYHEESAGISVFVEP